MLHVRLNAIARSRTSSGRELRMALQELGFELRVPLDNPSSSVVEGQSVVVHGECDEVEVDVARSSLAAVR